MSRNRRSPIPYRRCENDEERQARLRALASMPPISKREEKDIDSEIERLVGNSSEISHEIGRGTVSFTDGTKGTPYLGPTTKWHDAPDEVYDRAHKVVELRDYLPAKEGHKLMEGRLYCPVKEMGYDEPIVVKGMHAGGKYKFNICPHCECYTNRVKLVPKKESNNNDTKTD